MSQCFKDVWRRDEIQHNNIDPQLTTSSSQTVMPGGTISHVMVCSKIQKQQQRTPNRTKQDKKPKGKWIPFVKELLLNGKSVGKKAGRGRKEKRKRRAHSSVGEVSPLNWQ